MTGRRRSAQLDPLEIAVARRAKAPELTDAMIHRAVRTALGQDPRGAVSVALVTDADIADLHRRYMDDPTPTDVLTFDLRENDGSGVDGEVVVSVDTARRNARELKLPVRQEVLRYVIHGILHLCGLDDRTARQRQRMRAEEDRVLSLLEATAPRRKRKPARSMNGAQR